MPEESKHTEVPVEAARSIAGVYEKSIVVIVCYDPASQLTHVTTYGKQPVDKLAAAQIGDQCAKLICGDGIRERRTHEDFRHREQAEWAAEREELLGKIRNLEADLKQTVEALDQERALRKANAPGGKP